MTNPSIDPTDPFTRTLLRSITATMRAQPNETEAEYAARFNTATIAFATFSPRDPMEQMLAAQIASAQFAGFDCLDQAATAEDPLVADKLRRTFAQMNRAMGVATRLLDQKQKRPDEALAPPPPAIEPIPPLRRQPPAPKQEQKPMHREKAPAEPPSKDPAKMSDEELEASMNKMRADFAEALSNPDHPDHDKVMNYRPEDFGDRGYPDLPGGSWESYKRQ